MKITKQSKISNTALVGNITYRQAATYAAIVLVGGLLFFSPLFKWNWLAMAAYVAIASIVSGQTPTGRALITNIYGVVFKKPVKMVVSSLSTRNTIGHGIREVVDEGDVDTPPAKMTTGNYALVYNVTTGLNNWSSVSDYQNQANLMKSIFNVLEGGEGLMIVTKKDSDTGMLKLRDHLLEHENFNTDDEYLATMSERRAEMLTRVATMDVGRSVQQYVVLLVKPRNVRRVVTALQKASRIMRPATNPGDVLLSAMGLEGGVDIQIVDVEKELGNESV